jgi:FkbM family methyltransferase
VSHSQNEEERFIADACSDLTGRFLDIGAYDPYEFSNTRALIELGWSGVMVEPSPRPFRNLEAVYRGSSRVQLIRAAVVLDDVPRVEMYLTDDMLSTTEMTNYKRWADHAQFDGQGWVPAITLERIYAEHGEFDFVSIDTEGTSVDLLKRLLAMGKRPKCICVEYDDRAQEVIAAASACGYSVVYTSGENMVLVL